MPSYERIIDDVKRFLANSDTEKAYVEGYIAGKSRARWEVLGIVTGLLILACILFAVEARAEECADTFLDCETIQIDEDGPDQDPVYDEDDPVYDEMDDYDDL